MLESLPPAAAAELSMLRSLAALHQLPDAASVLHDGLVATCRAVDARRGLLALWERDEAALRWRAVVGLGEEEAGALLARVSTGVVEEVRRHGRTVNTVAVDDPRFNDRESVRDREIRAVLCLPLCGGGAQPLGVVYLEGEGPAFGAEQARMAELATGVLGAHCSRFLAEEQLRQVGPDPTREIRESLVGADIVVGRSAATAELLRTVRRCARMRDPVLLQGPSGSGKTTMARLLHDNSPRRDGPFVAVNCASLDPALLEARLFGTRRGGFTGAVDREGQVAEADGGTLFLDEVADLPAEAQVRLLSFLDDGRYRRVGGQRERSADVRLISATDQDLDAAVDAGRFRAALLFRLRRLRVDVPGLDARREDLPLLALALVARACARNGLPALDLAPETRQLLGERAWPGHVRQLDAALTDAVSRVLDEGGACIEPRHLALPGSGASASWRDLLATSRRRILSQALAATDGNRSAAARRLGLSRSRFYELLAEHDLG